MCNSQIFLNVMFPFGHRVVSVKNIEICKVLRSLIIRHWCTLYKSQVRVCCCIVCMYMCVMNLSFHSKEEFCRINFNKHTVFASDSVSFYVQRDYKMNVHLKPGIFYFIEACKYCIKFRCSDWRKEFEIRTNVVKNNL